MLSTRYPQAKIRAKNLTKDGIEVGRVVRYSLWSHRPMFGLLPVSAASGIGVFPEQLECLF